MDNLPNNWKLVQYADVTTKIGDVDHKMPKETSEGYPYISPRDFLPNNQIDYINAKKISFEDYLELAKKIKPEKGDIIFARYGTIGENRFVNGEIEFLASYSCAIIKHDLSKVLPKYSYYYSISPQIKIEIDKYINKSTQPNIGIQSISKFLFPLPPLAEQLRITNKIESLFENIDKSIILLEDNLKYTNALQTSILENTFINISKHSKILKIKEIAEIKGGKRLPKGETVLDEKTDYPYIRVTDFNDNGTIDLSNLKYLKKEVQEQIKRYIITSNDLYISIAGTIGKTGIIPKELDNANLTENAARLVFKPNLKINNRFIYYFTLSNNFKEQVGLATKTVAQPKLALTRLAEVEIPIPSIELQDKEVKEFDLISSKTNEILKHQHSQLTYLKALKASILDKAFKGEL